MHETSIVRNIMDTLKMELEPTQLENLTAIHVQIGLLSNIEPRLLLNAFDAYFFGVKQPNKIKMYIESLPIIIYCEDCQMNSHIKNYRFVCQQCGKPSKNLIQGEELKIHKIEFED